MTAQYSVRTLYDVSREYLVGDISTCGTQVQRRGRGHTIGTDRGTATFGASLTRDLQEEQLNPPHSPRRRNTVNVPFDHIST